MLVTEEEAKTKACCRTLCADIWTNPKEFEGECRTASTPCLGSECMAWRWAKERNVEAMEPRDLLGFCGLAGKVD